MSTKNWQIDLALMMGFGAGLYSFLKGFRIYREYRILEDTPEVPIRGVAMGLTHVRGQVLAEETLTSPVTRTPCVFYKVDIEKWEKDENRSGWRHYATDRRGVRFYLQDPTGKVLVDPHGADYDLLRRKQRVIGDSGFSLRSLFERKPAPLTENEPNDDELRDYLGGRLTPLDSVKDAMAQDQAIVRGARGVDPAGVVFTTQRWTFSGGAATGRFRLTEYCIVPGEWYNVTGTCIENPQPKGEDDRNLVAKGESEPTFLISWRDEADIESSLRNRALLYIFGGGAVAVACLYLFIMAAQNGWS